MSQRIAILDGLRTPFCKSGGALRDVHADDLGAIVVRELLTRNAIDPSEVDEVVFGNVAQPAHAANIARVVALKAGIPANVIAHTVHRNCASGMQAISTAAMQIQAGHANLIVAGGTESMSQIPLLFGPQMTELFVRLARAKSGRKRVAALSSFRPSFLKPVIGLEQGLTDPVCGLNMGQTAEILAREFEITRDDQDAFALASHRKAVAAQEGGRLAEESMPIIPGPRYATVLSGDDGPRPQQTIEALAKLRPYFDRHAGTVTPGNSCPITDGSVAVLLATEKTARAMGIEPLGFLSGWAYAALGGERMGLGPTYATARLLDQTKMRLRDFDVVELNEAFAAQVIANQRAMASTSFAKEQLDRSKPVGDLSDDVLNVNGGAIALGHPVGASGTRLILTALKELKRRGGSRALATLCVGGGQGAAFALEAA